MAEPVAVLGERIWFEGVAYVLTVGQRTVSLAGATLTLNGIDAASHAQAVREGQALSRAAEAMVGAGQKATKREGNA